MRTLTLANLTQPKCPCGSNKNYSHCCELYHIGSQLPQTAETLMRSRYCAYAINNLRYIKDTMIGKAAQSFSDPNPDMERNKVEWLGLDVIKAFTHKKNPDIAFVEFRALHHFRGKHSVLMELSEFTRMDGRWFYSDGEGKKSSRNDPCPCHSGKKFKACHGKN